MCKKDIHCDLKWQVEAITNILKNVVKYSNHGGKVLIECEDNNIYTQIKIIDYGKSMKMAEYMENHIGDVYEGFISSVMNFGLFVELDNMIEGLVHVNELKGDYYIYDENTKILKNDF